MTLAPDPVAVALIAGGAVVLSGIFGAAAAVVAAVYGKKNNAAIQEVHLSLNSRLDAWIKASRFEGQIQERDEQRALDAARTQTVEPTGSGKPTDSGEAETKTP